MATPRTRYTALKGVIDGVLTANGIKSITGPAHNGVDTAEAQFMRDHVLPYEETGYVVVRQGDSATTNGTNLLAAYTAAKVLTPNGAAISATNRAVVILLPGTYDLGDGTLNLDAQFVDVISYGGPATAKVKSTADALLLGANDVLVQGIAFETTDGNAVSTAASYASNKVSNCTFTATGESGRSSKAGNNYNGTWTDCIGGDGFLGTATALGGTYTRCRGGNFAFGGSDTVDGNCTGTFTDCTAINWSFGGSMVGNGLANAVFIRCKAFEFSFGSSDPNVVFNASFTSELVQGCEAGSWCFGCAGGNATVNIQRMEDTTIIQTNGSFNGAVGTVYSGQPTITINVAKNCRFSAQFGFGSLAANNYTGTNRFEECHFVLGQTVMHGSNITFVNCSFRPGFTYNDITLYGNIFNCSFQDVILTLGTGARMFGSTVIAPSGATSSVFGGACSIAQCTLSKPLDGGVTNAVVTPYNVVLP